MKSIIFLITLFSLISLIYSQYTSPKVNVSAPGDTESCGTAITGCDTYDTSSTEIHQNMEDMIVV